jgi:hypothetical protein
VADREALPLLPDGTEYDVAVSALIKTLRRGHELDALYWASQLSVRYPWKTWRLLEVFAAEDVGTANPQALPVVVAGRIAWEHHVKESRGRPPLVLLSSVILMLARSPKNREADDLAESMKHLIERGWQAHVPDYAIDMHTREGREGQPREGRLERWLTEGSVIVPDSGPKDWRAWILRWAVQRGHLDRARAEKQIQEWHRQERLLHGPDGYGSVQ